MDDSLSLRILQTVKWGGRVPVGYLAAKLGVGKKEMRDHLTDLASQGAVVVEGESVTLAPGATARVRPTKTAAG